MVKKSSVFIFLLLFASVSQSFGCERTTVDDFNHEKARLELGNSGATPTLPAFDNIHHDCDESAPLTLCDWAHSTDVVILANVSQFYGLTSPSAITTLGPDSLSNTCKGSVNSAGFIQIKVEDVLVDGLGVDFGSELDVYIGAEQLSTWNPRPYMEGDKLVWFGEKDKRIEPGMTLLMGLHYHEGFDKISLMGERLWQVQPDGSVVDTSRVDECGYHPSLNGATVDELKDKLPSCRITNHADERKRQVNNMWGRFPESVFSATCIPPVHNITSECLGDLNCPLYHVCVSGKCQPK